jgi:hypothetical protein
LARPPPIPADGVVLLVARRGTFRENDVPSSSASETAAAAWSAVRARRAAATATRHDGVEIGERHFLSFFLLRGQFRGGA